MDKNINKNFQNSILREEDMDLKHFLNFLIRNKLIIGGASLFLCLLTYLYSFTLKRIWEGEFQIVLKFNEGQNTLLQSLSQASNLIPDLSQQNDLKTQVGILESPSLLRPIFEYVVTNKLDEDKDYKFKYKKWKKKNLNIGLEKGTSILNIAYRDNQKEIVIPVLEKMTQAYQKYSGKTKKRNQELTKNYLKNQINFYLDKSTNSLKIAQDFAIEQDLKSFERVAMNTQNNQQNSLTGSPNNPTASQQPSFLSTSMSLESVRVEAANEIRRIEIQLDKINELKDSAGLQYIGFIIPSTLNDGLSEVLNKIDQELVDMRSKYKDNDETIIRLKEKKNQVIKLIKDRAIDYLNVSKLQNEAIMESAMRPKGVILKYKELIREAIRDENTLVSLENQLRFIELEQARTEDPWELITEPTLKIKPVSPGRKKIGFFGFLAGIILGSLAAYVREKRLDNVHETGIIENYLNIPFIEKIKTNDIKENSKEIKFLIKFLNFKKDKKVFLISPSITKNLIIDEFVSVIKNQIQNKDLNLSYISLFDFKENQDNSRLILVLNKQTLKFADIQKLKKQTILLNLDLEGFILID